MVVYLHAHFYTTSTETDKGQLINEGDDNILLRHSQLFSEVALSINCCLFATALLLPEMEYTSLATLTIALLAHIHRI
jgi:hypothetical protein